jgi:anti-anti-sigma regulatory factor
MDFEAASGSLDGDLHVVSVAAQRRLDRSGGRLRVVSANRSVLRVLGLTGLDEVFAVYPSRAGALNGDAYH